MDPSTLSTVPPERLEMMLRVLQESRLLVEAEAKKNEEVRKAREIELAIQSIKQQMAVSSTPGLSPLPARSDMNNFPSTNLSHQHFLPQTSSMFPNPIQARLNNGHPRFSMPDFANDLIFSGDMMIREPVAQPTSLAQRYSHFSQILNAAPPIPASTTIISNSQSTPTFRELLGDDELWLKDLMTNMSHPQGSNESVNMSLAAAATVVATSSFVPLQGSSSPETSIHGANSNLETPSPKASSVASPSTSIVDLPLFLTLLDTKVKPERTPSDSITPATSHITVRKSVAENSVDADDDLPPLNLSKTAIRRRARCRECVIGLSLMIIHGYPDQLSDPYSMDVTCIPCYSRACNVSDDVEIEPENVRARGRKRRVNVFGRDRPVRCEACGQGVGFGGIRLTVAAGEGEVVGEVKEREWIEPKFSVEVVCDRCATDFDFCTQCGGGGSYRTGKWRPRQLFKPGRRTCSLSHTRVGDLESYHAVSYRCPWERLPEFLPGAPPTLISNFDPEPIIERNDPIVAAYLRGTPSHLPPISGPALLRQAATHVAELHSHAYLTFFAIPAVMRMVDFLGSWDLLNGRCQKIQDELDMLILGGHKPVKNDVGEMRRFAAIAHVVRSTGVAAGKKKEKTEEIPVIMAVGLTTAQWSVRDRHVLLALGVVLGVGSLDKPGSMSHKLHTSLIRRIQNDVAGEGIAPPLHVWTLYRRRLSGVSAGAEPELMRAGFSPIDEYCARWGCSVAELGGSLESFLFDDNFVQWNYTIFVARWEDLRWTWGVRD